MSKKNRFMAPGRGSASTYGSVDELAAEIGISRVACYAALNKGLIPHRRLGRRFILSRIAIADWLRCSSGEELVTH